jgi:hypothetical protein
MKPVELFQLMLMAGTCCWATLVHLPVLFSVRHVPVSALFFPAKRSGLPRSYSLLFAAGAVLSAFTAVLTAPVLLNQICFGFGAFFLFLVAAKRWLKSVLFFDSSGIFAVTESGVSVRRWNQLTDQLVQEVQGGHRCRLFFLMVSPDGEQRSESVVLEVPGWRKRLSAKIGLEVSSRLDRYSQDSRRKQLNSNDYSS